MKKVLVIGKGVSGKSAEKLLIEKGFLVSLINTDAHIDEEKFSFAVLSPGIDIRHPFVQKIAETIEVISEVELALRYATCKIIAVTGTNGKSSLVTYLGHMFEAKVCGNIGIPACDVLPYIEKDHWAILELSSFQLQLMQSRKIDCAILLKVTDDHLDRHLDFKEYLEAKLSIKNLLKDEGVFYRETTSDSPPSKYFLGPVADIIEKVQKKFGGSISLADQLFKPLSHRLEKVGEKNGVNIINDSKATNPGATAYAIEKTKGPIVLIAGGSSKNSDFLFWNTCFKEKVKAVVCYGDSREKIKKSLQSNFVVYTVNKMSEAISKAHTLTSKGDTLLLSPGCASFDQFSGFAERGDVFKREVMS